MCFFLTLCFRISKEKKSTLTLTPTTDGATKYVSRPFSVSMCICTPANLHTHTNLFLKNTRTYVTSRVPYIYISPLFCIENTRHPFLTHPTTWNFTLSLPLSRHCKSAPERMDFACCSASTSWSRADWRISKFLITKSQLWCSSPL